MPLAGSFRLLLDPEPSRYYQRRTLGYEGMIKYWDDQTILKFRCEGCIWENSC